MRTKDARDSSILSAISPADRDSCAYASISERHFRVTDFSYSQSKLFERNMCPTVRLST